MARRTYMNLGRLAELPPPLDVGAAVREALCAWTLWDGQRELTRREQRWSLTKKLLACDT